jgi:hypothetical protein
MTFEKQGIGDDPGGHHHGERAGIQRLNLSDEPAA